MKFFFVRLLFLLTFCFTGAKAQDIQYSLPQSLAYGVNAAYILGQNSEGILVRLSGRGQESIQCYDPVSLNVKWKKDVTLPDRSATVEETVLAGDSILVFYSAYRKSHHVLYANLYGPRMSELRTAFPIDTVPSLFGDGNEYRFESSSLHTHFLIYNHPPDFDRTFRMDYVVIDTKLRTLKTGRLDASRMANPDLLAGYVSDDGEAYFVCGDDRSRNYNNAYFYNEVGVFSSHGYIGTKNESHLLSEPLFRFDKQNSRWIIAGLYSDKPGNDAKGTYLLKGSVNDTIVFAKPFLPFTEEFEANIAGGQSSKKQNGYRDHVPTDLVVRRDGGFIFFTESQSQHSETVASSRFNTMGGPAMVTDHYYYNEVVAFSMDSLGGVEWYRVLRKKQQSDNDGGYYLSYGLLTGPRQLWLVYNDRVSGENNLSTYGISANGDNKRTTLVSTDRKNIAPVPAQAKQTSANALVVPSLRKGYFQLIKITFPF